MGSVLGALWVRDPMRRRISLAFLAVICAVLGVWPRPYLASVQLVQNDSANALASVLGAGGGAGLLGSLLGGGHGVDLDLTVGRSQAVLSEVAKRMQREGLWRGKSLASAMVFLHRRVDVEALRGSVLEVSLTDHDPVFAKAVVEDYVAAFRDQLSSLSVTQSEEKRELAVKGMNESAAMLSRQQAALDQFRQDNHLALPTVQFSASVLAVTGLQAKLQAEQTALQTLLRFATDSNIQVISARASIAALEQQISAAQTSAGSGPGASSLRSVTPQTTEYENLYRDEKYAEAEYQIFKRYVDSVSIDEADAPINIDMIGSPYISPERQYNTTWVGALVLVIILAVVAEFYLARPPVGERR